MIRLCKLIPTAIGAILAIGGCTFSRDVEILKVDETSETIYYDGNPIAKIFIRDTKEGHVTPVECVFPFEETEYCKAKRVRIKKNLKSGMFYCTVLEKKDRPCFKDLKRSVGF